MFLMDSFNLVDFESSDQAVHLNSLNDLSSRLSNSVPSAVIKDEDIEKVITKLLSNASTGFA